MKDVYDSSNMYLKPELNYQMMSTIETYHCAFSTHVYHSQAILYSDHIHHSKNLFGCSNIKNKEFCILNKQYTEAEFNELVPQIIKHMQKTGEWGQFFPAHLSPHAYNESVAYDYFPLTKADVENKGWAWYEANEKAAYQGPTIELPDHINSVTDQVTEQILTCEKSNKLFKIIPQELKFYRSMGIPIPRLAPDQRAIDRMQLRNERKLYDRKCSNCQSTIQSTYAPDREEKVVCEHCYLKNIY
ncbi:hypothetical protein IPJ72_05725 [Candidatus Peregrinibacteria bacterium]|nr:MAG: hypothetical protein IPJ72_05725 [Candidatus Peregrinibacteria bacterium]